MSVSDSEFLHALADALADGHDEWSQHMDPVLRRAAAAGGHVRRDEHFVTLTLRSGTTIVLALQALATDPQRLAYAVAAVIHDLGHLPVGQLAEGSGAQGDLSSNEAARLVNSGVLTDELNAAVDWDPELLV